MLFWAGVMTEFAKTRDKTHNWRSVGSPVGFHNVLQSSEEGLGWNLLRINRYIKTPLKQHVFHTSLETRSFVIAVYCFECFWCTWWVPLPEVRQPMQLLCLWPQRSGPLLSVELPPWFYLALTAWLHQGNEEMSPPLRADVLGDLATEVWL